MLGVAQVNPSFQRPQQHKATFHKDFDCRERHSMPMWGPYPLILEGMGRPRVWQQILRLVQGRGKDLLQLLPPDFVAEQLIDHHMRWVEVASSSGSLRPLKYVVRPQRLLQVLTMPPGMITDPKLICFCLLAQLG